MALRWGIIGCGDVARRRVAAAIKQVEGSELIAACRRSEAKLGEFCRDFDVPRAYSTHQELLADKDIDAVYIATPVVDHCPQTLAAAEAGKHVLVEKPMAMSVAECDQMISACQSQDRVLGLAFYRRFYPVIDRIKHLLASGAIGEPRAVDAVTCNAMRMSDQDDGYWRVRPDEGGGGALMDIGSHRLNLFLDLFGSVDRVQAYCDSLGDDFPVDNSTTVALRFSNGVHGHLQCYFGVQVDPDEFTVLGTKGRLTTSPLNGGTLRIETPSETHQEQYPPSANFSLPLIEDFVAAVRDSRPPRVDGSEGRAVNEVIAKAYEEK